MDAREIKITQTDSESVTNRLAVMQINSYTATKCEMLFHPKHDKFKGRNIGHIPMFPTSKK